jgi:hypothetical protein
MLLTRPRPHKPSIEALDRTCADAPFGGVTGYQETYQEVAGSLVKIKMTARIVVAGSFGRCPRRPKISFETWPRQTGSLQKADTRSIRASAVARILARSISSPSWSVGVDYADANAGEVDNCAECGSPELEYGPRAWGN